MLQHSAQSGTRPLAERGPDFYLTPAVAVHALLRVEKLPHRIRELLGIEVIKGRRRSNMPGGRNDSP
jgi:hypothetical protein